MKFLKLFITVFAMAIAMNVSAQSKTTAKAKTTTTTTTTKAKSTTTAPAKKATAAKSTATTTAKSTATTTTASKPAATTTKTATASASKSAAASKPAKASSSFATKDYDPGYHLMLETKIGSFYGTGGFGTNIALQHEFHKYFAWDLFSVDFSMPFNANVFSVGLKTGIHGFSPYWWNGKMRAYSSLAVGYDCGITKSQTIYDPWEDDYISVGASTTHGFALSWGAGVQIIDHLFVGYTLEYSTAFKSTSHYAKIAWRF